MIETVDNPDGFKCDVLNSDVLRPFAAAFPGKKLLVVDPSVDPVTVDSAQHYDLILLIDQPMDILPQIIPLLDDEGILIITAGNPPEKKQLTAQLRQAGFDAPRFYYPFPDHLHPSVLLSEDAFRTPGFNTANLIRPAIDRLITGLLPTLQTQGHMPQFNNAVLIVAAKNGAEKKLAAKNTSPLLPPEQLAFSFTTNRTAPFNKMNVFYKDPDGRIMVRHIPYDPEAGTGRPLPATQLLTEEPYLPGHLYSLELHELLLTPGWSVQTLAKWARPYLDLLREQAQTDDGGGWLDGRFLDLTPFNLLRQDGRFGMIDLEWKADKPLPLPYVFFRGLYHTFARVPYVLTPAPGTPLNIQGLSLAVAEALGIDTTGLLENFLELEPHYFGAIFPVAAPAAVNGTSAITPAAKTPGPRDADLFGPAEAPSPAPPKTQLRLYPLLNLHLQVFVGSETQSFREETSTWRSIGLTREPKIYSIPLPHFTAETIKLRIDPSDHNGLIRLHAVDLRTSGGAELFHWTPFSRSDAELSGMMILNAGPRLPDPVTVLIDADPMLIFPLPAEVHENSAGPAVEKSARPVVEKPAGPVVQQSTQKVVLELELSALPPEEFAIVGAMLRELAQLIS